VITVVEDPLLPARPDPGPQARFMALGLALSLTAAVFIGRRADSRAAAG